MKFWQMFLKPRLLTIAALVPIATLLMGFYIIPHSTLGWALLSQSELLSESLRNPHIEILVDHKPQNELQLVRLRLANVGNQTIRAVDFDDECAPGVKGLAFEVEGQSAQILSVDLESISPPNRRGIPFRVSEQQKNAVIIPPFNINPGESYIFSLLLSSKSTNWKLVGHIAGTKIEDVANDNRMLNEVSSRYGWIVMSIVSFGTSYIITKHHSSKTSTKGKFEDFMWTAIVTGQIVTIALLILTAWLQLKIYY